MTTDEGVIVDAQQLPEVLYFLNFNPKIFADWFLVFLHNNHPVDAWMDIENVDIPKDLPAEKLYQYMKQGFAGRNYKGKLTLTALFARTTEHVTLEKVETLTDNGIRCVDLGLCK